MLSVPAAWVTGFIRLSGGKARNRSAAATLKQMAAYQVRPERFAPPKSLDRRTAITVEQQQGWTVYRVSPKTRPGRGRALYLHGGSWYRQISASHWRLIAQLAVASDTTFIVPIYPLAPVGTAGEVVRISTDIAAGLIAEVGAADVSILGDSAGGSIALSVAQQLRDRGIARHRATVLMSPALDLTFTDPRIAEIDPSDPWLATPGPSAIAKMWAGSLDLRDPLVSPVFGDLNGLAPITLFSGTRDVTNADAHALVRAAAGSDVLVDLREAPGLIHVYPLLPTAQGRRARAEIGAILS
jgi:acetyl esterase/lipase